MSNTRRSLWRKFAPFLAIIALIAMSATGAFGAHGVPGPPHEPPDEGEVTANSLSVPALFVPGTSGSPFTGTCPSGPTGPTGDMGVLVDGVLEHPDYYVQGVATWQAECANAADNSLTVAAEWGDNLTNAPLKQGTPIRVEIGFLADAAVNQMGGYTVVKLDPTLLDRESHYGTLGVLEDPFPEVRVWNAGVTLSIVDQDGNPVPNTPGPFSAEVNATGRVVYGFNWQQPVAGEYTITVVAPTITIGSADAGTVVDAHTVTLDVSVGNKGGGGGGGGGRPPDRPRGGGHSGQ